MIKHLLCAVFVLCMSSFCPTNASWWNDLFRDVSVMGSIDVAQDNDNVVVTMTVPNDIDVEDIVVDIKDYALRVHGKTEAKKEVNEDGFYKKEMSSSRFNRSVSLPCLVDDLATKAEITGNILVITMPKLKEEDKMAKKIRVTRK